MSQGKPEKFTVAEVESALRRSGGFITHAARLLGCHYHTILNYIDRYPELDDVREEIRETYKDTAESLIIRRLNAAMNARYIDDDGKEQPITPVKLDLECAFRFLRYQARDRGYIDRVDLNDPESTQRQEDRLRALEERNLSEEQLRQIAAGDKVVRIDGKKNGKKTEKERS